MFSKQVSSSSNPLKILRTFRAVPDWYWSNKMIELGVDLGVVSFDKQSSQIFLKPLGIFLVKDKHDFLLKKSSLNLVRNLTKVAQGKFYLDDNDELNLEVDGIKLIIQNEQDLGIAKEIFVDGIYNLIYNKPVVVWDIGMNVGFASLYLAAKENVVSVFGYEPFKMTCNQAERNFDLNPNFSEKIKAFDYGIGGEEQTLTIEYNYECKASIGIWGIEKQFQTEQAESLVREEIKIKPATEILAEITRQYPNTDIVAKIDCEGSEYDIIKTLHSTGQLNQIRAIIMEWHQKGPDELVNYLQEVGFAILSRRPKSQNIGMIYAVRT
jgi:FkbM family methyltransferase